MRCCNIFLQVPNFKRVFIFFYVLTAVLLGLSSSSAGQSLHSLSGSITDSLDRPLASATVFIVGMKKITSTSNKGAFGFEGLHPGTYQLSVSMVGFAKHTQTVFISDLSVNVNIKLKPVTVQLTEVTVNVMGKKERENYFKVFQKVFLGETANSKKCRIVNPDVINLTYDKKAGVLNAYADEIIVIENKALGYSIQYSLVNFSYQIAQDNASFFGNGAFEELPADAKQKEDWEAARAKAYYGSIMHFFRGLYKGNARREGFIIHQAFERVPALGGLDEHEYVYIDPNEIDPHVITKLGPDSLMRLQFTKLYITYAPKQAIKPQLMIVDGQKKPVPVVSNCTLFYLLADGTAIDQKGDASNHQGYTVQGNMALRRVADQLPFEYTLKGK
ncbi:carboxypeptidase-like regulatory domain-containing protein [Mucilaginibacter defluvii]